jgi:hypothetical protein
VNPRSRSHTCFTSLRTTSKSIQDIMLEDVGVEGDAQMHRMEAHRLLGRL